jgi:hypothetical protein
MRQSFQNTSQLSISRNKQWKFTKSFLVYHSERLKEPKHGTKKSLSTKLKIKKIKMSWATSILIYTQDQISSTMQLASLLEGDLESKEIPIVKHQLQWSLISVHQVKTLLHCCHMMKLLHFSMSLDMLCTTCVIKPTSQDLLEHLSKETSSKCQVKCLKTGCSNLQFSKRFLNITRLMQLSQTT